MDVPEVQSDDPKNDENKKRVIQLPPVRGEPAKDKKKSIISENIECQM